MGTTKNTDLAELEVAFQGLVDALIQHRRRWKPSRPTASLSLGGFVPIDPAALPKRGDFCVHEIVADPVGYSILRGIRDLAQAIYNEHGMRALTNTAERVCNSGPGGFSCRMAPVDSALNGVGKGKDKWWS